jgi:hypothetical protein
MDTDLCHYSPITWVIVTLHLQSEKCYILNERSERDQIAILFWLKKINVLLSHLLK